MQLATGGLVRLQGGQTRPSVRRLVEVEGSTHMADDDSDLDAARTLKPPQAAAGRDVDLSHRLRSTRRAEGATAAGPDAQGDGLQADAVRRHRVSACTLRRAAAPTIARRWNNGAAASPARLAGRAGPEARPLARHPPSAGLLVSRLGAGQRTRSGRQPAWPISALQVSAISSCQRLTEAPCGTRAPMKPRRGQAQRRRAGRAVPG